MKQEDVYLRCEGCARYYPIVEGIPHLAYLPEQGAEEPDFNTMQAQYERDYQDAESDAYEEGVIKNYGDKTELIATGWAESFEGPFLDFGCGTGQVSRVLTKHHSPVFAFDIASRSVRRNAEANNVFAVEANAFYLPFKDRIFETVCSNGVLHHIVDLESCLQEMARITNKNIAISEPAITRHYPLLLRAAHWAKQTLKSCLKAVGFLDAVKRARRSLRPHDYTGVSKYERHLQPEEIIDVLKKIGFEVTMLQYWTNMPWKGRSEFKKRLTKWFASSRRGTHFELRAERRAEKAY